ncbi:MAG: trypsin-like peptidase domain-containing protein [Pelolinea sp.]|nr:trypsin-like peptidase domain-containing protein [Pelolinea sp.]
MKKKVLITGLSFLLILSMAACSGEIQLDFPTAEAPTTDNEQAPSSGDAATGPLDLGSLSTLQDAYITIYDRVLPSVVSISVSKTVTSSGLQFPETPFGFDQPQEEQPFEYQENTAGSGFIWDSAGHIVTNNHVVESAEVIRVVFADGRSELAELVGADSDSDLAVLKVNLPANELTPIAVSDSTKVKVGQIAVAIGNPFQLASSMTTGIVSGVGRSLPIASTDGSGQYYSIPDVIQTDAAINPGNSGGVLVDIDGSLIGVTTAIESPVRANSGVGYVIPSVIVSKIVPILIKEGEFQQPWIGISGRDMIPEIAKLMDLTLKQGGALVIDVTAGSPADKAGLLGSSIEVTIDGINILVGGDVITSADGIPVNDFEDLVAFLARYTVVGQTISLTILRDGEVVNVDLTLAARPSTQPSADEPTKPEEISKGAWLGIFGQDVTSAIAEAMDISTTTTGVLIEKITAGSPADDAGLRGSFKPTKIDGVEVLIGGDVITAVDDEEISSMQELFSIINRADPGTELVFSILRDGESLTIAITLGEKPE